MSFEQEGKKKKGIQNICAFLFLHARLHKWSKTGPLDHCQHLQMLYKSIGHTEHLCRKILRHANVSEA